MIIDDSFNRQQYAKHMNEYVSAKQEKDIGGGSMSDRIALLSKYLPVGSNIFEIGSGAGEDASALQNAGYVVTASDFVPEFVKKCEEKGLNATLFNAKKDELPDNFEAIYANAVFVHFPPSETTDFLVRAKRHLTGEKIVFLSVLIGEGSRRGASGTITFERDFQYYDEKSLKNILDNSGYSILISRVVDEKWIQIIAKANNN